MGRVFGDLRGRDRIVRQRTRPQLQRKLGLCKERGIRAYGLRPQWQNLEVGPVALLML
jgi:hypothetical protein